MAARSSRDPRRVVMFSGGVGSWGAARRSVEEHGAEQVTLLFADTLIEDDDLYRFVLETAAWLSGVRRPPALLESAASSPRLTTIARRREHLLRLGADGSAVLAPLEWIAEGRDPHQVYGDVRFLGNSRVDPCSSILKRRLMRRWPERSREPGDTACVLGFDWSEVHRLGRAEAFWSPWRIEAPLTEKPLRSKEELIAPTEALGIRPPRLYAEGFAHNNCDGFCCKAGQASFALLLRRHPDRYRWHEEPEEELRSRLDRDVSILRDRRGGRTRPLTMRLFRRRLELRPGEFDRAEWGACSCMEEPPTTKDRPGGSPEAGAPVPESVRRPGAGPEARPPVRLRARPVARPPARRSESRTRLVPQHSAGCGASKKLRSPRRPEAGS
jgi:hypothetical protein